MKKVILIIIILASTISLYSQYTDIGGFTVIRENGENKSHISAYKADGEHLSSYEPYDSLKPELDALKTMFMGDSISSDTLVTEIVYLSKKESFKRYDKIKINYIKDGNKSTGWLRVSIYTAEQIAVIYDFSEKALAVLNNMIK